MKTLLRKRVRMMMLLISLLAFPVTLYYMSPVIPYFGISSGLISGSIIVFLSLFLISFIFGRLFCGWVCPAGSCQEFALAVNNTRVPVKKIRWIKYLVWIPWILVFVFLVLKTNGLIRVDFLFGTEHGISVTGPEGYIVYFSVLTVFLVPAVLAGRRTGCHTICWMAPFMVFGRKLGNLLHLPGLRLKARQDRCSSCGSCTQACPMSLDVRNMVQTGSLENSDCILCGNCGAACPEKVIRFSFSRPAVSTQKGRMS